MPEISGCGHITIDRIQKDDIGDTCNLGNLRRHPRLRLPQSNFDPVGGGSTEDAVPMTRWPMRPSTPNISHTVWTAFPRRSACLGGHAGAVAAAGGLAPAGRAKAPTGEKELSQADEGQSYRPPGAVAVPGAWRSHDTRAPGCYRRTPGRPSRAACSSSPEASAAAFTRRAVPLRRRGFLFMTCQPR